MIHIRPRKDRLRMPWGGGNEASVHVEDTMPAPERNPGEQESSEPDLSKRDPVAGNPAAQTVNGTFPAQAAYPDLAAISALLNAKLGDRFEVLQPIAIGGMATLFQLRHRKLGGLFVAKVLHAALLVDDRVLAAFCREARHVTRLSGHPAVVPVFDSFEEPGFFCILMPFVEGEDLDRLLVRAGRFSRDEALMLVAQLASVLMFAESVGITHCDLAPGNIRLDPFGQYRLFDFGLSRSNVAANQEWLAVAGTPAYNSPEQIRGEPPDIRSDLYSLGCILVEVITGRTLFTAPSLDLLQQKHLAADWHMPPEVEVEPAMARLVRSLLAVNPASRIQSAFELAGIVAAFGFELPSFSRSLGATLGTPPRPRRRRLEVSSQTTV